MNTCFIPNPELVGKFKGQVLPEEKREIFLSTRSSLYKTTEKRNNEAYNV